MKSRFDPSSILLYIAASVEQYCDITQVNALPENEGILERTAAKRPFQMRAQSFKIASHQSPFSADGW
jgi:hypothetical protein